MLVHQAVLRHERRASMLQQVLSPEDLGPDGWMSLGDGYADGVSEQLHSGRYVVDCASTFRLPETDEAVVRGVFLEGAVEYCRTTMARSYMRGVDRDVVTNWSESRCGYYWDFGTPSGASCAAGCSTD